MAMIGIPQFRGDEGFKVPKPTAGIAPLPCARVILVWRKDSGDVMFVLMLEAGRTGKNAGQA
jgi:hypothetical protein